MKITVNGVPREVADGTTVAALIDALGLPPRQIAVEINQQLAPRATHANRSLDAGDTLEVVSLVGGG